MQNVQPSDRLRKEIRTFFQDMGSADNGAEALSELVRMASTFMVQQGLEAEQADFVGRERLSGVKHLSLLATIISPVLLL